MDAVRFIEESKRMCSLHDNCLECCARADDGSCKLHTLYGVSATEKIELIEAWYAAHPRKTRQSVFLDQWPDAMIDETGILAICPAALTKEGRDDKGVCGTYSIETCVCKPCRREFWMQEVG